MQIEADKIPLLFVNSIQKTTLIYKCNAKKYQYKRKRVIKWNIKKIGIKKKYHS